MVGGAYSLARRESADADRAYYFASFYFRKETRRAELVRPVDYWKKEHSTI